MSLLRHAPTLDRIADVVWAGMRKLAHELTAGGEATLQQSQHDGRQEERAAQAKQPHCATWLCHCTHDSHVPLLQSTSPV